MTVKKSILDLRKQFLSRRFPGSTAYWQRSYEKGNTSGPGSYGKLAEFKARILNEFMQENAVQSVIEFGCGDGNQISLIDYPKYVGLDVAPDAVALCIERFESDVTKSFFLLSPPHFKDNASIFNADLAISLDVIFHLTEEETYEQHLSQLFTASTKWVIIYGYDEDKFFPEPYSQPRKFTTWVDYNLPGWKLESRIVNEFGLEAGRAEISWSDFYIFKKINA